MPNYKNGKIYKLCSLVSDKIYVGSTCQPLCKRLGDHKSTAKRDPERPVYKHINLIGWQNYKIILIKTFPCNNKEELEKEERYYIEKLHSVLNYILPTRTMKEYRQINNEELKIKKKQYYQAHKEHGNIKSCLWRLKQKFKKLIIDSNDTSKEHDELINKFTLIN